MTEEKKGRLLTGDTIDAITVDLYRAYDNDPDEDDIYRAISIAQDAKTAAHMQVTLNQMETELAAARRQVDAAEAEWQKMHTIATEAIDNLDAAQATSKRYEMALRDVAADLVQYGPSIIAGKALDGLQEAGEQDETQPDS